METPPGMFPQRELMQQKERQRAALESVYPVMVAGFEPRDVVPALLARRALRSSDMGAIYSKSQREGRVKKLFEILQGRDPWWGPLIDSLIRSGHSQLAERMLVSAASTTPSFSSPSSDGYSSSSSNHTTTHPLDTGL